MRHSVTVCLGGLILALTAEAQTPEGVYTAAQAARGSRVYTENCAACHGPDLMSGNAPPLSGAEFFASWSQPDRTLEDLFYVIQTSMPRGAGNTLPEDAYLSVVAFILQQNGQPPGNEPLVNNPELLAATRIQEGGIAAAGEPEPVPTFIEGPNGLEPAGDGPTQAELNGADQNSRDWLYHTHDYTGRRYVDLSEINRSNVSRLRPECLYQFNEPTNFQTGPIVYDGVMYVTTTHQTVALNAATCRPLWKHVWQARGLEFGDRNRGVAIKDGRVLRGTDDGYLIALDRQTGQLLWARQAADPMLGESITMPPLIYDDLVFIGPAFSETGISGWIGAFRLADGEPLWRFNTVPGARETIDGLTWDNPQDIVLGGGGVWTPLSMDLENEELYVAVTNPAPDLPADLRPGPNLYTNSIVALDARTGDLRWYKQMVPNDDHDWDLTQVSPVFTTTIDGRPRSLVSTVGKDGILRVLDRTTREQVYEAEVTTIENIEAPVTTGGVRACPGTLGGVEWNGPAFHPPSNTLFTVAVDWCTTFTRAEDVRFIPGQLYMGGSVEMDLNPNPAPGEDPRIWQGWLTGVDAGTGEIRWRYRSEQPMVAAVTTTGGGLVLSGELTGDFIVLDADSGEVLYRFNTGGPMGGGIVSYEVDGRQYIAVASGTPSPFWVAQHPGSPTMLVFALP